MRFLIALLVLVSLVFAGGPGFRSKKQLDDHFTKHAAEFGQITKDSYLLMAQELRDAPVSPTVLESVRKDGVITRFDKKRGYFGAFNRDRTIRTFFVPNDGERYFHRQAQRP